MYNIIWWYLKEEKASHLLYSVNKGVTLTVWGDFHRFTLFKDENTPTGKRKEKYPLNTTTINTINYYISACV